MFVAGSGDSVARPVWSRPIDAVVLVLRGRTARVAVPVAAVVGTVISVVASVAYLSACRSTHQR